MTKPLPMTLQRCIKNILLKPTRSLRLRRLRLSLERLEPRLALSGLEALGMIETKGWVTLLEAGDAMLRRRTWS